MQTIPTDLAEKHGVGCPPERLTIMPGKVNHYWQQATPFQKAGLQNSDETTQKTDFCKHLQT